MFVKPPDTVLYKPVASLLLSILNVAPVVIPELNNPKETGVLAV